MDPKRVSRREFLKMAGSAGAGLAAGSLVSRTPEVADAAEVPWSYVPTAAKPKKIVYVRSMFQDIFDPLAKKFQEDWGIPVEIKYETNTEEALAKALMLYTTGEQVDAIFCPTQSMGMFMAADAILPIEKLPGASVYIDDFNPVTKATFNYAADHYAGLPQGMMNYVQLLNRAKLEKANIKNAYTTWDEMVEQCLKAKKDGVSKYPFLWIGGVGAEQLPGTFFSLVWNRGGVIFEKDGRPAFGLGSVARETLKWWARTFTEWQISDPLSLEVRFIPAAKAFGTGDYLYMGPQHDGIAWTQQDPTQYPAAKTTEFMKMPGTGATLGFAHQNIMLKSVGQAEWAWKWMQYMGGRVKDGSWLAFEMWAKRQGTIPNFRSLAKSPMYLKTVEGKSTTLDIYLNQCERATAWKEAVPQTSTVWYPKWVDLMNVIIQNCLRGQITADKACDEIVAAIDVAKKVR